MKYKDIPNNSMLLEIFKVININDDILKLIIEFWYEQWYCLTSINDNLKLFTMNDEQKLFINKNCNHSPFFPIDICTFLPKNIEIINYAEDMIINYKKQVFQWKYGNYSYIGNMLKEFCLNHITLIKIALITSNLNN